MNGISCSLSDTFTSVIIQSRFAEGYFKLLRVQYKGDFGDAGESPFQVITA